MSASVLVICLGSMHAINICCVGVFYYVITIIFQVSNWNYCDDNLSCLGITAKSASVPLSAEDLVLREDWSATTPYRAIIIMAACSLGFAVLDVIVSSAEMACRVSPLARVHYLTFDQSQVNFEQRS
eukprot:COSAG02_NODE_4636_length_5143_cov_4.342585_3_plen_127_part_00